MKIKKKPGSEQVRVFVFLLLVFAAAQTDDQVDDPPYCDKNTEEHQESADAEINIVEFHDAGPIEPLADLDSKCYDQDHGHNVEERDDHRMAGLREPEENGVKDQDHGDAESTDNEKMQLLVGQAVLTLVVQSQKIGVDPGDQHDDIIQECLHLISPFIYAKAGDHYFCFT